MKLGIDLRPISRGGGIGHSTLQMVEALISISQTNSDLALVLCSDGSVTNQSSDLPTRDHERISLIFPRSWKYKRWLPLIAEHIWWPLECARLGLDAFVSFAFPLGIGFAWSKKITIGMQVHDLSSFSNPDLFSHSSWFSKYISIPIAMRRSDVLFIVSSTVKKELADNFPKHQHKAIEVPLAVENKFQTPVSDETIQQTKSEFGITGKYLFWVGNTEPYKNLPMLLQAYDLLTLDTSCDYQLVLAGIDHSQLNQIMKSDISDRIVCTGWLDYEDERMAALYQGAFLFLFPSLHESVGLPLLEAMASGVPIVTSDLQSIRDTTQGNAVYIDPESAAEISDAVCSLSQDDDLRKLLSDKGRQIAGLHSWKSSANMLVSKLNEL